VNGTTLGGKMDFTAPNAVTEPGQKLLLVTFHQHWIAPNTHQRHQSFVLFELPQKPFRPFRNSGDPSDLGERSPDKQGSGICQQGAVSGRRDTTRKLLGDSDEMPERSLPASDLHRTFVAMRIALQAYPRRFDAGPLHHETLSH